MEQNNSNSNNSNSNCNNPVVCHLRPLHKPNEQLLPHCKERSTLFVYGRNPISLGRNRDTQISKAQLSRHLCRIQHDGTALILTPLKGEHSLHVNGRPVTSTTLLKNDDVISLCEQDYQYQVLLRHHGVLAAPLAPDEPPLDPHGLDDEFLCAVCFDIISHASVCVPCSHIFCRDCIATTPLCPLCRAGFTINPIQQVDQVIQKLIRMGGIFSAEDVGHYIDKNPDWSLTAQEVRCDHQAARCCCRCRCCRFLQNQGSKNSPWLFSISDPRF
jgi:Zinc finger, C3HC4 type (RING finger)/FHA domain